MRDTEATITTIEGPARSRVCVAGEFDVATYQRFVDHVARCRDTVEVDLGHVSFLDSTGLLALLRAKETVTARGRGFKVVAMSEPVRRLLTVAGATDEFDHAA